MPQPVKSDLVYRFGVFMVSPASRELLKQGRVVKIQDQPFALLLLFLEHPGEILDRQFFRSRLWPEDTFVGFAQSLSTAVTKLRQVLGDDAVNPRFIETIPRHGYRFIAPVSASVVAPESPPVIEPKAVSNTVAAPPERSLRRSPLLWISLAIVLLAAVVLFFYLRHRRPAFALAPKDTVVLADFENTTGETIFNDTLHQALMVEMAQSPLLHLLPDRNATAVFRQMGHSPDDRITGRTALELCRRVGGKVLVQGSISGLGTTYLVGLAGIRCDNGKPIAHEQMEAAHAEDVVDALGQTAAHLRARLGESLPSINKYDAPLEQATTASLEALQMYGKALSTWDAHGDAASLPYFQRTLELDPQFAMAYGGLATVYHNLGKEDLARESTIKAFDLRSRVTEAERASIEARYYLYVTQEVEKAEETYATLAQEYPDSAGSLNHLASTELKLGRNEEAAGHLRKALELDPTRAATYVNLAAALVRLMRLQEAEDVLATAEKRGLRIAESLELEYWLGFLAGDEPRMQGELQAAPSVPGAMPLLLSAEAQTQAWHGRMRQALQSSVAAAKLLDAAGDYESAAQCLGRAAVREGEAGRPAVARQMLTQAAGLDHGASNQFVTALVFAQLGDQRAVSMADRFGKQYPDGTFIRNFWLPVIRARLALTQHRPEAALAALANARNLDPVAAGQAGITPLYANYLRGQAYLALGKAGQATAEFRALREQRGQVINSPVGSLAALGLARSLALEKQPQAAADIYRDLLEHWKEADPDFAPARRAREEANLR